MKNKIDTKIGNSRKYLKFLAFFMFFYFGWRLIALPFLFIIGKNELVELYGGVLFFSINIISSIIFVSAGIISAYNLLKFKKWALIMLTILISLHAISILINTYSLGKIKIPITQITVLLFALTGFRHIKNAQ
ncbi:MAG: hypothetical protein N3D20_00925 [Candidatus Pacearchaeota archaeon]|nr:hypothetical protein [Candidatus Pacearchaeota archaeon]